MNTDTEHERRHDSEHYSGDNISDHNTARAISTPDAFGHWDSNPGRSCKSRVWTACIANYWDGAIPLLTNNEEDTINAPREARTHDLDVKRLTL